MGQFASGTLAGLSRADGTTARTVTVSRTSNTKNGFTARDLSAAPNEACMLTHTSYEQRGPSGLMVRHLSSEWIWNYVDPSAAEPLALAGKIIWNKTGLHIPANCPANVRKDVRSQIVSLTQSTAGSVGLQVFYNPLLTQDFTF